jgi:1-acyl-sn-glycerol-3-phosphate acyltransferase
MTHHDRVLRAVVSRPRRAGLPARHVAPRARRSSNHGAAERSAAATAVAISGRGQAFGRDPDFVARMRPLATLINSYFATEFRGWEHVPRHGPCLIVGNHSGGAQPNDFVFLLHKWVEERGTEAPLYGLAYDLFFDVPVLGQAMQRLGIIRANHANGREALASGAAVSVFPGGEYEVFRSWSERNRIDFGGHKGFVRLAIDTGVPVVPMTIHGAHESTFVLTRGRGLARAMGLDRLHIGVYPLIWNIPFGLTPASVPSLQLPSKVTVHFGVPLDWSRYRPGQAHDPAVLQACYDEITGRMQKTLSRLARAHPYPVLERLRTGLALSA